jgi:hypothetical protein
MRLISGERSVASRCTMLGMTCTGPTSVECMPASR